MNGSKILWGQMLGALVAVLAGTWGATEWTAWRLGYPQALGFPWFDAAGIPFYRPDQFFIWWYRYDAYAPRIFAEGAGLAAAGGIGAVVLAIVGSILRGRQAGQITTYGSARWATGEEVQASGVLQAAGVYLGRWGRETLRHDGPEHVLAFAPTRSGKGVGLVVPTLLSWNESVIVHDIKGENWALTAGWRAQFSHCLLFDPTNPRSASYNPLLEIRRGQYEVRDAQNIADILVDPEGALDRRTHWDKTSHTLLVAAILHVLYAEQDKTLAGVVRFLADPVRPIDKTLRVMMTTPHLGARGVHPVIAEAAREVLNKSENERSGVVSTAMSFLSLYRDPVVASITRHCDWRIADLMEADRPVSLYLVIPPSDISRTKPLIRLILNQIGRRLTERLDNAARRWRLLMMLDEFPALGRLDFFEASLSFIAGYGIRAFLIAQSLNQIQKAYGEHDAILDNCHIRVCFAANDERTAKRISDALGTATELRAMKNYAGHRLAPWLSHLMVSRQETARPLMTPGEVMQLPATDEIVMVAGNPPIRAKKLRYYEDPDFVSRVLPAPVLVAGAYADRPPSRRDDWSGAAPIAAGVEAPTESSSPRPVNRGVTQEPDLPEHEAAAAVRAPANEFKFADDDQDDLPQQRALLAGLQTNVTRAAAMDRDDGLQMDMS